VGTVEEKEYFKWNLDGIVGLKCIFMPKTEKKSGEL